MNFLSIDWLVWMWLTVGLYWLTPQSFRTYVLMVLSLIFLGSISPVSVGLIVSFCVIVHVATNIYKPSFRSVALASAAMLAILIYYKVRQSSNADTMWTSFAIPLGLSYYTFRCLHYMVERYKGYLGPNTILDLAGYLFFIPTLVVGPIHRYNAYSVDKRRQRFDPALLSMGFERIIQGYAKIVILSNFVIEHLLGNYIGNLPDKSGLWATYLEIVRYGLNLFFQFSGHVDVAIGFALMLGFRVMENFNWPYLKPNIQAFWQNWHMSLSQWCREMLYGMVVAKTRSPSLGALTTMVAIGLWHEVSLRYIAWGAFHGFGLIIWSKFRAFREKFGIKVAQPFEMPIYVASVLLTVHFVWFSFVLLNAPSLPEAGRVFLRFMGLA